MKSTYFESDDILVLRLLDKPIVREVSQNWSVHISYAEDGSVVEVVVLDANSGGAMPVHRMDGNIATRLSG